MIEAELEKRDKRKAAKEAVQQMNEEYHNEIGEGFEAQLEDVDFESSNKKKKKSLFKKVFGKIMPKKPLTEFQAREMARQAMLRSRRNDDGDAPPPGQMPFELIDVVDREESLSDLDSLAKKNFPVQEVMMKDGYDSRDDSSVSSLGTQHILERMGPGPLMPRQGQRDTRDPTPTEELVGNMRNEMFMPPEAKKSTPALIDRIDSGNLTEDARGKQNSRTFGFFSSAMCAAPGGSQSVADKILESPKQEKSSSDQIQTTDALFSSAIKDAESRIKQNRDERELKKALSPIEECEDLSPRAADGQQKVESTPKPDKNAGETGDVIDLTAVASPKSPATEGGIKQGAFSFDDIMDIAADKLNRTKDDKYAIEGDESPTKQNAKQNILSPQSSLEVCKNNEGDVVMWSDSNAPGDERPKHPNTGKKDLNGPFSEHLFDLLSTDESVSRGRKKVPFLTEQRSADTEVTVDEACMFDLSMGACGKKNSKKPVVEADFRRISAKQAKMDPNVGVMCGAVPLYFMYKDRGDHDELGQIPSADMMDDNGVDEEVQGESGVKRANQKSELASSPQQKDSTGKADNSKRSNPQPKPANHESGPAKNEVSPEHEQKAVGKVSSGQREATRKETAPASPSTRPPSQGNKVKVLLDRDDAYWDTLSTIASTKDKSAGSYKLVAELAVEPGPIPVEITMEKKAHDDSENDGHEDFVCLVEEDSSAESLSRQLAALSPSRDPPMQSDHEEEPESPAKPPRSLDDGLEGVVRQKETESNNEEDSVDNSQLLLAVTRSEGEDDGHQLNSPGNPGRSGTPNNAAAAAGGWQVRGYGKPFRIETETKRQGHEGLRSYLPKSPARDISEQNCSSLYQPQSFLGGFFSSNANHHGSRIQKLSPDSGCANAWKNNRSVSWGFEEIFWAFSPTSPTSSDGEGAETTRNDRRQNVSGLPEPRVSPPAQDAPSPRSPTSNSTPSTSLESAQLSVQDEQELISRTLQLSRQLLSSMSVHDLEGADGQIVESLINFDDENDPHGQTNDYRYHEQRRPPSYTRPQYSSSRLYQTKAQVEPPAPSRQISNTKSHKPSTVRSLDRISEFETSLEDDYGDIPNAASGRSEDSPIDVEALFNKYDNLANHLIGKNTVLQDKAVDRNDENTSESSSSPIINSRLDELRAQRAKAIAKMHGGPERQSGIRTQTGRSKKDHLAAYATKSNHEATRVVDSFPRQEDRRSAFDDFETTSAKSDLTTPSTKARELRRQLDEALQASRQIKNSQEQLGSELQMFKNRFYSKNGSLEDRASKAIGGF